MASRDAWAEGIDGRRASIPYRLSTFLPDTVLSRSLVILGLVTLSTAWVSELYFWPDEHWQVLEFMSYKLGITPSADLTWEFGAQVRAFMQPFLYWLIAKSLLGLGIRDMFVVVFVLRLATGLLSFLALARFSRLLIADLPNAEQKHAFARMLPFMGFLPYLFVRTAGETASMAFFMLGMVAAITAARATSEPVARKGMLAAGIFCGMAFETRFQSGFFLLGLFGWLALIARVRLARLGVLIAGGVLPVAAAVLIDRWGYGVWCFPLWNYFDIVLWQGLAARLSGSAPFFAFFYLVPANIFAPIVVVLLIALVVACLRNPKHYVTWTTAAFFLGHCLMAHKEERFLFPLAILATAWPVLAFAPGEDKRFDFFDKAWAWRRSRLAKFVGFSAAAAMVFCAVYPFGIRPHMPMAKYLYRHFPQGLHVYTFEDAVFKTYPIYRPPHYDSARLAGWRDLRSKLDEGPVYLLAETPTLAPGLLPPGVRAEILYSEFPFAITPNWAPLGTRWMCGYAYWRQHGLVHPPRLAWMSLYRLTREGAQTAQPSPCLPRWSTPL